MSRHSRATLRIAASTFLALAVVSLVMSPITAAHEGRIVGDYEIEVGFLQEPAVVNLLNGAFVAVTRAESEEPVRGLDESLEVEVIVGGGAAKRSFAIEALPEAGTYVARFIPSVVGDYTFRLFGDIEGFVIDETFESGPGRFSIVEGVDAYAFPEASADAENGVSPDPESTPADSSDGTARAMAAVGITAGLAGLALGGLGLARRR